MIGVEKILIDEATKVASNKAGGLLKALFGKAFEETGEIIADNIRLRRFKNQVEIFEKAKKYLKNKKISENKISLKVLAPLIEFSSLEEEEDLQDKWARLIKNILSQPTSSLLQQHAIQILNKISNEEALILDELYKRVEESKTQFNIRVSEGRKSIKLRKEKREITLRVDQFSFLAVNIARHFKFKYSDFDIYISNLIALGLVRYETEVNFYESTGDLNRRFEIDVNDYYKIKMTKLGHEFVQICS